MFKKIYTYWDDGVLQRPSTALRIQCEEIKFPIVFGSVEDETLKKLFSWQESHERSQGLAANQIGQSLRMAVVKIRGKNTAVINPEFVFTFGRQDSNEGCHSIKDKRYVLPRPIFGICSYYTKGGEKKHMILGPKFVRFMCHEIDHMDGKLISDKGVLYNP